MTGPSPDSGLAARLHGRYHIDRLLGRGGMGAVYLARDLQLDRQVAIKELPAEFSGDALLRERFLREVRTAAGFSHPNIVPVYAVEEQGDALAFVMGYVEGESLADRVRRNGPLGLREAARLLQDVAYALAYAHGRDVVHRDLKPDNIMIERATGRALLMDFGVARAITTTPVAEGVTRIGEVVGTPEYMSPEQATGDVVDGRSDLYALGLTAYFALTGEVAFGGDSVQRVLVRQLTELLPPLSTKRPDLPASFTQLIDRCLAKDRGARMPSAPALIEALEVSQASPPEVPASLRVLVAELSTVVIIGTFALATAAMGIAFSISRPGSFNGLLPGLVVLSVFAGRILQTRSEVGRLLEEGFKPDEIRRALSAVLAEREERRMQLRSRPVVLARRTRTVRAALVSVAGAVALFVGGLSTRHVENGRDVIGAGGLAMVYSAMMALGLGLVLLLRNPLKAGGDERLLQRLWLSPLGARLMGLGRTPRLAPGAPPVAAPVMAARGDAAVTALLQQLDARLARIEQRLSPTDEHR